MSNSIYSLQWSAVENAQTYRVFRSLTEVGNKQELVLTSNRSLELNQYISGSSDYYYFIKAQATGYQDSDYSTPLRWKTFSISRSVDAGVIVTNDDDFVGEGFGYNTGFVAPAGKIFNRAVCLLTIGGIQHPEYISFLTGDKAFNIDIPAESVTGDIVYSAVVQDEITQLATPTIAMNADGKTLEITDVANATSYDVYVDGTLKTNVASVPNTTTVDLSTLSDIAEGAHTVKVKAKADRYTDSEFSNEIEYTKVQGFTLTLNVDCHTSSLPNKVERVKIGSAPTSDDDFDYQAGWNKILNKAGTALGGTVTVNNVFKYYTWTTWTNGTTDWQTAAEHTEHSYTLAFTMTCLTGDTLITMSDGSEKRIDTIKVGDKVLSYNPETDNLEEDEVTYSDSTENKQHDNFDVWTFDDGTIIKTVHRHRFYNVERNAMVYMDEWNIGDHAIKMDGTKVALVNHVNVQEEVRHYTIFTNHQNYFVNGLLSGNRYTKRLFIG